MLPTTSRGAGLPVSKIIAPLLLSLLALLLLSRTWMSWLSPTIDTGRELNIPARIAQGERLYRDVACFYGPVPVWLHAAAYRVFGFDVRTPLALLLPSALLTMASLYSLARRAAGQAAAFWGMAWAISIVLVAPNNAALVFPYSFGAAHSLAFSTAALALVTRPGIGNRALAGCAFLWGLALASRPEYPIASIGAAALTLAKGRLPFPRVPARFVAAVAASCGLALGLYGWALRGLPLSTTTLDGPLVLLSPPAEWRNVYRLVSGLGDVSGSLNGMATAAFLALLTALVVVTFARLAERLPKLGSTMAVAVFAALAFASVWALTRTEIGQRLDRDLPPLLRAAPPGVLLGALAVKLRSSARAKDSKATGALVALLAFSGLSALRVPLFVTYGFTITPYSSMVLPGLAVAAAVGAFHSLPQRRGLLAVVFASLVTLQANRIVQTTPSTRFAKVNTPRGPLRLPRDKAQTFQEAIDFLSRESRLGDSLAGFPEAAFFNFAMNLPNPLRQDQIFPGHLDRPAEDAAIARLHTRRPRFILLVNQESAGFGPVSFGRDYAQRLWQAVEAGYRPVRHFGKGPKDQKVGFGPFFIRIYQRNEP